jgi:hypothetical protein
MAKDTAASKRVGGPGAAHENRKEPGKSKSYGRLNRPKATQGSTKRTAQNKSGKGPDSRR